ncbi:MAG: hypothetical protein ABNH00_04180 [Dokdonia sp.]|jgi:Mn2+/Fe2+ NRAMP family transporter
MKINKHIKPIPTTLLPILVIVGFMLMPHITAAVSWSSDDIYEWTINDLETPSYESEEAEEDTQDNQEQPQLSAHIALSNQSWSFLRLRFSHPIMGHGRTQELFSPPPELT